MSATDQTRTEIEPERTETGIENRQMPIENDSQQEDQTEPNPNNEAARWRVKLRETEAERDQLTGQLEAARRQVVEGHASRTLYKPEGLWAAGSDLHSLFDEAGTLDPDRLNDAITDAAGRLGLTRRPVAGAWQGKGNGPRAGEHGHRGDFSDAFRPRDR